MVKKTKKGLYIKPIGRGTTIDHLPVGTALKVLRIVGEGEAAVTVAMRVPSGKMGTKDLVFVENRFLGKEELDKIALIARNATVNLIENGEVKEKTKLEIPEKVTDMLECINPNCITNKENIPTKFYISKENKTAKCHYCEKKMNQKQIASRIKA